MTTRRVFHNDAAGSHARMPMPGGRLIKSTVRSGSPVARRGGPMMEIGLKGVTKLLRTDGPIKLIHNVLKTDT